MSNLKLAMQILHTMNQLAKQKRNLRNWQKLFVYYQLEEFPRGTIFHNNVEFGFALDHLKKLCDGSVLSNFQNFKFTTDSKMVILANNVCLIYNFYSDFFTCG